MLHLNTLDAQYALFQLYRLGLYNEAVILYKQFRERDPDDHLIIVNLQACYACLGHGETSSEDGVKLVVGVG